MDHQSTAKTAKISSLENFQPYGTSSYLHVPHIIYVGVPKASIENVIKKAGSKGTDSSSSELVVYDAQGPSGYHMIIEAFTGNNRKTRPEIKNLLAKYS